VVKWVGRLVAIKIRDAWWSDRDPKEVRILTALQGHPCLPVLHCWFPLPRHRCHAMVTELIPSHEIEDVIFKCEDLNVKQRKIRRYMSDMLHALAFMHKYAITIVCVICDANGYDHLIDIDATYCIVISNQAMYCGTITLNGIIDHIILHDGIHLLNTTHAK
jgi:hypothetical protein